MFDVFKINRKFKLKGNRSLLRTDSEMMLVNRNEADNAFKLYKKQYIDTLLKSKGFLKYKSNAYVRRNQVDVLEYIDLQKEIHGSRTFTVNYALTALYIPHEFFDWDYCERMGELICKKDVWWDFANDKIAKTSFENVARAIEVFVIPWFDSHSNNDAIKKMLSDGKVRGLKQAWLEAIDSHHSPEIIEENVRIFGLPKMLGKESAII